MENVLYVGNLPFDVTASELRARFAEYGEVTNVQIVSDREPRRTRCFGVVTMRARADGAEAIRALNGSLLSGRSLVVSWMEGRVLSANPARSADARDTRDTVPPLEDMTSRTHAAPAAKPRPAASFDEDGEPERRKKRHGAAAEAPPVRMLQQFRERTNMTYELECSGTSPRRPQPPERWRSRASRVPGMTRTSPAPRARWTGTA